LLAHGNLVHRDGGLNIVIMNVELGLAIREGSQVSIVDCGWTLQLLLLLLQRPGWDVIRHAIQSDVLVLPILKLDPLLL